MKNMQVVLFFGKKGRHKKTIRNKVTSVGGAKHPLKPFFRPKTHGEISKCVFFFEADTVLDLLYPPLKQKTFITTV